MKSYSSLVHEFSVWQRRELEALFIVLDWTKNYQKKHPNQSTGKDWLNATELTIRIIYDEAFSAVKNRAIAFFSGSDTTEAPPEIIRSVVEDLEKHVCPSYKKIESSTSTSTSLDNSNMVNVMYFGPAYTRRISENSENSSTQDIPFGFQFPNAMHFHFDDKKQDSTSNLSFLSSTFVNEGEQKQTFLPFPSKHFVRPPKNEKSQEVPEIYETSHLDLDLTKYFNSSLDSQSSNPAIDFFRISSGFKEFPKNSDIAKNHCTSPFCLCSSVKASYKNEKNYKNDINEENLDDDDDDISEVPIEPYLEVENTNFPKLELPDLFDDTSDSLMLMQPFNTPDGTKDLDTSNSSSASSCSENLKETNVTTMPGTPRNNVEDKELMLQPFNTPVTPGNMSGSSNLDTSLNSSLGVADLGLDEDIARILTRKCSVDYDEEYIQQERLRILSSYEKSRMEQNKTDENENELNENDNFATSTPNWRH